MTRNVEPTYLRTTFDGLRFNVVHKDNSSDLPIGLVGIYEEIIRSEGSTKERVKILEFFYVWALLKKEVSVVFILRLLENWTEDEVVGCIAQYSRFFNTASGKYVLYHERLRVYLLQRISHFQFKKYNSKVINECQIALHMNVDSEWEHYALEFLSSHLLINAIEERDVIALKRLVYDTTHWGRQVQISKNYEWTKRMLNNMLLWASKFDDDEVIECMLNMIDVHRQEQMDAPRIVELVAQHDIETALRRIDSFGSLDEKGLRRKFLLYINCILELIGSSEVKGPSHKQLIARLLKHMDDNIPVDLTILNWNDFLPSFNMFILACQLDNLGLDYLIIFKRADNWGQDWIEDVGEQLNGRFGVLFNCVRSIVNSKHRDKIINTIIEEFVNRGWLKEAEVFVNELFDADLKSLVLLRISSQDPNRDQAENPVIYANEYLQVLQESISENYDFDCINYDILFELSKQGFIAVEVALDNFRDIVDSMTSGDRIYRLKELSNLFSIKGKLKEAELLMVEALEIARQVRRSGAVKALKGISTDLANQGNLELAASVMQEALDIARQIKISSPYIAGISTELARQGQIAEANSLLEEALNMTRELSDESSKCAVLTEIATELRRQGRIEEALVIIREALNFASNLFNDSTKEIALQNISIELFKIGRFNDATQVLLMSITGALNFIEGDQEISTFKSDISIELSKQGFIAVEVALDNFRDIVDSMTSGDRIYRLKELSNLFSIKGKLKEAELLMVEALEIARQVRRSGAVKALKGISTDLANQGNLELAASVMQEALDIARQIKISSPYIAGISTELARQGQIVEANSLLEEALNMTRELSDESIKCLYLKDIACEYIMQGKLDEAGSLLHESLTIASRLNDDNERVSALQLISIELAKQGNRTLAEEIGLSLTQINLRHKCWRIIAENSYKLTDWQNALFEADSFQNAEVRPNFLKGLANSIRLIDCTKELVIQSRMYFLKDIESMHKIMRQYALHEIFFSNISSERISRLNQSLNIQWASRIRSTLSANYL